MRWLRRREGVGRVLAAGLAGVLLAVVWSSHALAHMPLFFWNSREPRLRPYLIRDVAERSTALYGLLGEGELHRYRFVADAGDHIYLALLVPAQQAVVPGAVVRLPDGTELPLEPVREAVFEAFTQMRLVRVGRLTLGAPATGLYEVIVFPAETLATTPGGSGRVKYVLSAGEDERFGPFDLLKGPLWWLEAHLWLWR